MSYIAFDEDSLKALLSQEYGISGSLIQNVMDELDVRTEGDFFEELARRLRAEEKFPKDRFHIDYQGSENWSTEKREEVLLNIYRDMRGPFDIIPQYFPYKSFFDQKSQDNDCLEYIKSCWASVFGVPKQDSKQD